MNTMSAESARAIAIEYLSRLESEAHVSLQLVENETIEKDYGWIFFYNSKKYLETGDFRFMLAGNAPFIVDKNCGIVHVTGTDKPIQDYIAEYEKCLGTSDSFRLRIKRDQST